MLKSLSLNIAFLTGLLGVCAAAVVGLIYVGAFEQNSVIFVLLAAPIAVWMPVLAYWHVFTTAELRSESWAPAQPASTETADAMCLPVLIPTCT